MRFIDYVVIFVKWKKQIIISFILSGLIIFPIVRFGVEEQFDAKALIIPSEDNSMGGISGLLQGISNLPVDMFGQSNTETTLYNNIIYSRTNLSKIIDEFDLVRNYDYDTTDVEYYEKTLKELNDNIFAGENVDLAYEIETRANSPQLAADITNYIVQTLNQTIVELKIEKSKDNRIFLEKRLREIELNLKTAEDSLLNFQKKSGLLNAEEQLKGIVSTFSSLESELIKKEVEQAFYNKILNKDAPSLEQITIGLETFQKRMKELKEKGGSFGLITPIDGLPDKVIEYMRAYREVEINSKILEFVLPLYEQAKFEEQKDVPVFQILDYAIPPAKKSFPPRILLTLAIAFFSSVLTFLYAIIAENKEWQKSEKIEFIRRNIFQWKRIN